MPGKTYEAAIGIILMSAVVALGQQIWYVDRSATGSNDGTSWGDAFIELRSALNVAQPQDQVWVAAGVYTPDFDLDSQQHTGDRGLSFNLTNGITVYGGFAGAEEQLSERAGLFDQTILSGDLAGDDTPEYFPGGAPYYENSCRLITTTGLTGSAILDGFTIEGALARECSSSDGNIVAIVHLSGLLTLANCRLIHNATISGGPGGAVYNNASLMLQDCVLEDNAALTSGGGAVWNQGQLTAVGCSFSNNLGSFFGGAVYNSAGSLLLADCTISDNSLYIPTGHGGGVWNRATLVATGCVFSLNSARYGGALHNVEGGDALLNGCEFTQNYADDMWGGAVVNSGTLTARDTSFINNVAYRGGALAVPDPDEVTGNFTELERCRFSGNHALDRGGAINYYGGAASPLTCRQCEFQGNSAGHPYPSAVWVFRDGVSFENCVFSGHAGQAVRVTEDYTASFAGCTFYGNSACTSGVVTVVNSIFWGNTGTVSAETQVSYSNIPGVGGIGNIHVDPLFVDADGPDDIPGTQDDDLRLSAASPCIDAGDSTSVGEGVDQDLDGLPRLVNDPLRMDTGIGCPVVDMGAYEYPVGSLYCCPADLTGDSEVDAADLAELLGVWGSAGMSPADLNNDGVVDAADLAELLGSWGVCGP